jgi:tRNA threonylcarbamoyladenosine biosynthesis protein TsaB
MTVLACETSTLLGSVAIVKDEKILAEKSLFRQGSHTDILNQFISECLEAAHLTLADIDGFASGLGPGSFTGVRISLNTIKTLGYIHNKPVCGFDSLYNLAYENKMALAKSNDAITITPMINAYKNMVYTAEYQIINDAIVEIRPPSVVRVQELDQFIRHKTYTVGDGFAVYEKYFNQNLQKNCLRLENCSDYPTAASLGRIATQQKYLQSAQTPFISWHKLLPLYLRASEAEEVLAGIKYQPL